MVSGSVRGVHGCQCVASYKVLKALSLTSHRISSCALWATQCVKVFMFVKEMYCNDFPLTSCQGLSPDSLVTGSRTHVMKIDRVTNRTACSCPKPRWWTGRVRLLASPSPFTNWTIVSELATAHSQTRHHPVLAKFLKKRRCLFCFLHHC